MLALLFERRGFDVEFTDSGSNAMALLEHFKPDVIILDIWMPGMDGFEVCKKIKKDGQLKDIPIIFLSALPTSQHQERALSVGACAYIEKPFSSKELIDKVENVIK